VAQNGAGELGEETLDQVEPGAVLGCKGELEAALALGGEPSFPSPWRCAQNDYRGST
jgi:hypothetical protein